MKKIVIGFLLLAFISVPVLAHAERPDVEKLGQPVLVADVNIVDSTIVSQSDNTFVISFGLKNGEGTQTGVKYGIRLQKDGTSSQFTVDEKVYDEALTLPANTLIKRQVTYTAPAQLNGDYTLYLTSQNSSGFPFGVVSLGKVTLSSTAAGVYIDPMGCTISSTSFTGKSIDQAVVVNPKEPITVHCSLTNTGVNPITVQPVFVTHYQSAYGEVVPTGNDTSAPITIAVNEKKDVTFSLPEVIKPQRYVTVLSLNANDAAVSNAVTVSYVVNGASATIQNATLDKNSYRKGDQAQVLISYTADKLTAGSTISVGLLNKQNKECAPAVSQDLTDKGVVLTVPVSVSELCTKPQIAVTITNGDGTVLDQKTFTITNTPLNKKNLIIIIGALIVILGAGYLLKKKHKPAAMGLMLLGLMLLPSQAAHAGTYSYSPQGTRGSATLTINIDKSTYSVGEQITATAVITSNSPDQLAAYLTVSANGGGSATLIPATSLAPYATTGTATVKISAPSTQGSATVDFKNGMDQRLIMGSTSGFATSAQACTMGDPNSHSYYQPMPYNPTGPSTGSYIYLSSSMYDNHSPYNGGSLWYAMQYMYSGLTTQNWSYSGTYSVQIDNTGRILDAKNC